MQNARKKIVLAILAKQRVPPDLVAILKRTHDHLTSSTSGDGQTEKFERSMRAASETFSVNMKDEVMGLRKDLSYLSQLDRGRVDLTEVLVRFHSSHEAQFRDELRECKRCVFDYCVG